jgi:hypothetical protein
MSGVAVNKRRRGRVFGTFATEKASSLSGVPTTPFSPFGNRTGNRTGLAVT